MELSNNILKHANATEATLQLIYYDTYLELMAEDNGTWIPENKKEGIGLMNINSRVNYLKGKINIDSGKSGTTIVIQIPYK
jgi:signal transduction histidine kinase